MIYKNFHDFHIHAHQFPHRMLGLDIGTKTLGIAVSDSLCKFSSPLKTLQNNKSDMALNELTKIIDDYVIKSMIVGYPLHMNGDEGDSCRYVDAYVEKIVKKFNLPVLLWDERMSTLSAERLLIQGNLSRSKRKEHIDALAASIILQSFLDSLSHQFIEKA